MAVVGQNSSLYAYAVCMGIWTGLARSSSLLKVDDLMGIW